MQPWQTIDSLVTSEGRLELRRRGEGSFLITIGGRVLMTSVAHRSESELARLACAPIKEQPHARVLLGGLGMGYTLRAALDELPRKAQVTVVDLNQAVVTWCKGPLGALTNRAIEDRRVRTRVTDVARVIAEAPAGSYDAIILDLYEGPHEAVNRASDPLYGGEALERTWAALRPGGVLAIWSEEPDKAFEARLAAAGFASTRHAGGRGGRAHVIYLGVRSLREKAATRGPGSVAGARNADGARGAGTPGKTAAAPARKPFSKRRPR